MLRAGFCPRGRAVCVSVPHVTLLGLRPVSCLGGPCGSASPVGPPRPLVQSPGPTSIRDQAHAAVTRGVYGEAAQAQLWSGS